ncbi:major facilitator superfamily domain-containing protein [Halteromyces radiatus]|uniref:major facilitator superfamily domain-containing protein n=1 Tax=Halteromyces radiatus TaxID=101107 RepID=UPI00222061CD|nr:major facilitator superfamily domain-containing protein [Halteromyces radiatus]KAI8089348.1 major facilitator superfamily domain-containing protein [Halteromyces radiatus]
MSSIDKDETTIITELNEKIISIDHIDDSIRHSHTNKKEDFIHQHHQEIMSSTKEKVSRQHWWQFWKVDLEQMAMKPIDFPRRTKRLILMTIALATLIAPISTTIYMPALVTIQTALNTDDTTMNATLSAFTFTIAVCPIFWSALGDAYGRRRVYLISFIIYIFGSVCCALSVNIGMFIAFRIVSAIGSSSVMSMGAGTIADVFAPSERGRAFAMYATGPLLGPALGPIIGGYLNLGLGWRSDLAFVAIYGVIIWLCILFFLPETTRYPPALPGQLPLKRSLKNPFSALMYFKYTNIWLSIAYTGLSFLFFYMVNTTFTRTLTVQYRLSTGTVGLCYLPLAGGAIVGNQIGGRLSDRIYNRRVAAAGENQIYPEMRISGIVIALSVGLACCGYVAYGWCITKNVHYAFALVAIFFCKY